MHHFTRTIVYLKKEVAIRAATAKHENRFTQILAL
jgi:hypothetical protein